MPKKEEISEVRKQIQSEYEAAELADLKQRQSRARSFTVGAATGGVIEVGMRGDFASLWYVLKPVEVAEIIEQLAASAGLEVALRPKQNFTAWRSWDSEMPAFSEWKGSAPWQLSEEQREEMGKYQVKQIAPATVEEEIKKLTSSKEE